MNQMGSEVGEDRERTPRRVTPWVFTGLLAVAAALLFQQVSGDEGPLVSVVHLRVWALIPLFYVAERAVVLIYAQRESRSQFSFSLTEAPLILGLVFANPLDVMLARVLAGLLVLLAEGHRDALKMVFNLVLFALEVAVALFVFSLVLGGGDPTQPAGWLAVLVAMSAETMVGLVTVPCIMFLSEGYWSPKKFPRMIRMAVGAGLVNISLGIVAMLVLVADLRAGLLLLLLAALLATAYKDYSALNDKHESLVLLHEFTQRVSLILGQSETAEHLLRESLLLLRAEYAELAVRDEHGDALVVVRVRHGEDAVITQTHPLDELPLHRRVLARQEPVLVPRGARSAKLQSQLIVRGLGDAVVVPLRGRDGLIGTLCIAGRMGILTPFTDDDVRLTQTVANHAGILLENGRLVDRLRTEAAEKEHQAQHDALTGLPNRSLFQARVQEAVAAAGTGEGKVAVMLLDLDRFKEVNDTLGHHVGDELLQTVGARLRHMLPAEDMVARLGGDEFGILLANVHDRLVAEQVAERARTALEQPFTIGSLSLVVGASLGIVLGPDHGDQATTLLQRADVAMYAAKEQHRGVVVYSPAADQHSPRRLALVGELRKALDQGKLDVHYQPKADASTGGIVGVEALLRWLHPQHGAIAAEEFIPIAERTGMIHPLTTYVLRTALTQCRQWRRSGIRLDVAVNVSSGSLLNIDFPYEVRRLLDEAGVAPRALTLEITESSIMADPKRCIHVLSALSGMGVQLAIDDFGTGYSSLSQLKQLPVNELKIDKSFIVDMTSDDDDAMIVRSTVDLGHNLGLRVVAEGVEDRTTWQAAKALGCDVVQGFYLSPAITSTSLIQWFLDWQRSVDEPILPPVDERLRGLALDVPGHPGIPT
jgi:diguanylate cyclase (GGDEF)-like protein